MTAGAGANLNQQFGMPIWVGVFLCTALTIFVSLLDFKKSSVLLESLPL